MGSRTWFACWDLLTLTTWWSPEVPSEERDELQRDGLPYRKTYAYVFTSPQWFRHPLPYRHPNGAVTWVRLPDLDLDNVEYVAPAERELV